MNNIDSLISAEVYLTDRLVSTIEQLKKVAKKRKYGIYNSRRLL